MSGNFAKHEQRANMRYKIDGDALVSNRGGKTKMFKKKHQALTAGYLKNIKNRYQQTSE